MQARVLTSILQTLLLVVSDPILLLVCGFKLTSSQSLRSVSNGLIRNVRYISGPHTQLLFWFQRLAPQILFCSGPAGESSGSKRISTFFLPQRPLSNINASNASVIIPYGAIIQKSPGKVFTGLDLV